MLALEMEGDRYGVIKKGRICGMVYNIRRTILLGNIAISRAGQWSNALSIRISRMARDRSWS